MSKYAYDLKINSEAQLLKNGGFPIAFPNCGEVLVTSQEYEELIECETALSKLMSVLASLENKHANVPHVIMLKVNPLYSNPQPENIESENWEEFTIMKAFIADAQLLKNSVLKFNTFAQIRSVEPTPPPYYQ